MLRRHIGRCWVWKRAPRIASSRHAGVSSKENFISSSQFPVPCRSTPCHGTHNKGPLKHGTSSQIRTATFFSRQERLAPASNGYGATEGAFACGYESFHSGSPAPRESFDRTRRRADRGSTITLTSLIRSVLNHRGISACEDRCSPTGSPEPGESNRPDTFSSEAEHLTSPSIHSSKVDHSNKADPSNEADHGNENQPAPRSMSMTSNGSAAAQEALRKLLQLALDRLATSLTTLPSVSSWVFTLGLLAAAGGPIALCGYWAGALSLPHANFSPLTLIKAVFVPCLAEELLWRALLIPNPLSEKATQDQVLLWMLVSTALYVVAHPVLAFAVRPRALALFGHPGFLGSCALLGLICAAAYRRSGSVWPAVFLHWAVVAVWLSLGGRHKAPF